AFYLVSRSRIRPMKCSNRVQQLVTVIVALAVEWWADHRWQVTRIQELWLRIYFFLRNPRVELDAPLRRIEVVRAKSIPLGLDGQRLPYQPFAFDTQLAPAE